MSQDFNDKIRATKLQVEQAAKDKALREKLRKEEEAKAYKEAVPRLERLAQKFKEKARELTRILRGVSVELKQKSRSNCETREVNICYSRSNTDRWKNVEVICMELTSHDSPDGSPTRIKDFTLRTSCTRSVRHVSDDEILNQCEAHLQTLILCLVREHPDCVK